MLFLKFLFVCLVLGALLLRPTCLLVTLLVSLLIESYLFLFSPLSPALGTSYTTSLPLSLLSLFDYSNLPFAFLP